MTLEEIFEYLGNSESSALKVEGFDDCIVGVGERCGQQPLLVYDVDKMVEKIQKQQGCDPYDARDQVEAGYTCWMEGPGTPIWLYRNEEALNEDND